MTSLNFHPGRGTTETATLLFRCCSSYSSKGTYSRLGSEWRLFERRIDQWFVRSVGTSRWFGQMHSRQGSFGRSKQFTLLSEIQDCLSATNNNIMD
jgi:hypothetical protein